MATMEFTLTLVSPTFMYGAYQRGQDAQPEVRAQSVRGQLRYWLRAILGAHTTDLKKVWEAESAVFGSTGMGSAVSVRVYPQPFKTEDFPMLPHKRDRREKLESKAIPADTHATLQLVTRPGVPIPEDVLKALKVWSLLGGIGKRSRRLFGAIEVKPKDNALDWYGPLRGPDDLEQAINKTLHSIIKSDSQVSDPGIPSFPTLHPAHSCVIVGKRPFDDLEEANDVLFPQLLRSDRYRPHQDTFGTAKSGLRRASPLHAQLRKIGDKYYVVLTALRSLPEEGANRKDKYRIEWNILADFMKDAARKKHFDGGFDKNEFDSKKVAWGCVKWHSANT